MPGTLLPRRHSSKQGQATVVPGKALLFRSLALHGGTAMDIAQTAVVERIARVLAGQRLSTNADGEFGSAAIAVDNAWPDHTDDAIAVLRTMRAPDEDMAAVGDVAIWERMIAAALGTPFDVPPRAAASATPPWDESGPASDPPGQGVG